MVLSDPRPPVVSVAMPVFNVAATILDAIESIRFQTLADWELIVIDDGSTDGTRELLRSVRDPRVRVIAHDDNAGLARRLNEAVELAQGEYVARLDGDDFACRDRLETQLEYLRSHPDVDVVGSWLLLLDKRRKPIGSWKPPEDHDAITKRTYHSILLAHPTYFARRDWFVKNPYRAEFLRAQDHLLLMETASHSTFANVQRMLVAYSLPDSSVPAVLRRRYMAVANTARFFARRRQYGRVIRTCITHTVLAAIECIAEVTRLRQSLLRYRIKPVTEEELREWAEVWSTLSAAVGARKGKGQA
jgi:glycosyltransferase involved in cell wall biosynthesis